jgi:rubredoxin
VHIGSLPFTSFKTTNRNDLLPTQIGIPAVGGVIEIELTVPSTSALKPLLGIQRYGPLLFTHLDVVDSNGTSNPWPLCVQLNLPVILGVTSKQVKSGGQTRPAEVYADLLRKNLSTLVKGTTPGHLRHGAESEDPPPDVFIYGCNFDFGNMTIKPVDLPAPASLRPNRRFIRKICTVEFDFAVGPLQRKFQFDLQEIGVALPTMADLEDSTNYVRNAVLMAFGVQVVNGGRGGDESNVWQWPMWLPVPGISAVEPDKNRPWGNAQHLGQENGSKETGEVRWYLADPFNEQRKPMEKMIQGVAADLQKIERMPYDELSQYWNFGAALRDEKTVVLPPGLAGTLSAIRDAGEICEVRPNSWADDTVAFQPPFEKCYRDTCGYDYDPEQGDPENGVEPWTPFEYLPGGWKCPLCKNDRTKFVDSGNRRYKRKGFAVVWRGDIPSLPLPINPIEYVKDLARRLWRPVAVDGAPDFTARIPVPAGTVIRLGVERLEDIANDLVGRINLFDQNGYGLNVKFAFLTKGLDTDNYRTPNGGPSPIYTQADKIFDSGLEPNKAGIGALVEFVCNPMEGGDIDLQLHVSIDGKLKLFGKDVMIPAMDFPIGPLLRFHIEKWDLPTAAIFFQQPDYGGAALVALEPKWLGDQKRHIDFQTPGANEYRVQFIEALDRAKDVLNVAKFFSGSQCLDAITTVIGNICAIGRSVIDSYGRIENVSESYFSNDWLGSVFGKNGFNDDISSVIMIGPPHSYSGTIVKCWQHSLRQNDLGICLELKMPDNQFIFMLPRFDQLPRRYFNQSTLSQIPATQTVINLDNAITGIEFVK